MNTVEAMSGKNGRTRTTAASHVDDSHRPVERYSLPRLVRASIVGTHSPISVDQIASELARVQPRRVFKNSIYRILRQLRATDEIVRVVTWRGWLWRRVPGQIVLLLCRDCGVAQQVGTDLHAELAETYRRIGFRAGYEHLELIGHCETCRRQPFVRHAMDRETDARSLTDR